MRAEFNRQLQVFMAEKPVTGVEARVTEEIRLFTAASAVTLTAGWPGYTGGQVTEVLIYPTHFDEGYRFKELNGSDDRDGRRSFHIAGIAHPWGVVILARPELTRSFDAREGGYHVGIHEFAHLIDLARSQFDGVPSYLSEAQVAEWDLILAREEERLQRLRGAYDSPSHAGAQGELPTAVPRLTRASETLTSRGALARHRRGTRRVGGLTREVLMFCRVILAGACVLSLAGCQQASLGENSTAGVTAPSSLAMKAVDVPFSGEVSGEAAFDTNPKGCAAGFTTVTRAKGPVSHMGLTTWYSEHCLNLETSEFLDAELWLTAANGDQIHGTYAGSCTGGEKIGDAVTCTTTVTFAGGTGRFENATGTAQMRATIIFEGFEDPAWPGRWEWKGSIRY